ncbi:MAG: biotin--[acetyl-CoA-carboxylase] ligase [Pseudolabrys sp.]
MAGVRHIAYETLGSTNAEALACARAGEREPLWITARTQSAGRGRRGTRWVSAPGNLFATLLLSDPARDEFNPQLSFVAALAVHDAVTESAPQIGALTKLKWPNDLLIGGRKAAGLLIEGESEPINAVAIGVGVNCASHPDDTAYPATDLAAEGARISAETLFSALMRTMQQRLDQWNAGQNFGSIRANWLARAAGVGEPIRVRLPERELAGRFQGLDDAGRLLVAQDGGHIELVTAGEVFALGAGALR